MSKPLSERIASYIALKAHGHSPAKAAEILLDAKRSDPFASTWVDRITALQEKEHHD